MEIFFDINSFILLSQQSPLTIGWVLFINGGWIPFAIIILKFLWDWRLLNLIGKYLDSFDFILLAIDVPKLSEQSPKAMEQVFATISGAHSPLSLKDRFWYGKTQLSFSFEIVSIDGYIQFLVYAASIHRDLVEAAIHAHYPDAEITEVQDYVDSVPKSYPNSTHNMWGSELSLVAKEAYPIRTYVSFEHTLSGELKDPLAGLLETMSRIQKNEQVWLQIVILPTENSGWVKNALKEAFKVAGKQLQAKPSIFEWILSPLYKLPNWFAWTTTETPEQKKENILEFAGVMKLTPGERKTLEAIEMKASKIGFVSKLRLLYISPHEQFQNPRVISSVFGGIKQFGDLSSNSFKPNKRTKTQAIYFFPKRRVEARRRRLIRNYRNRSWWAGSSYFILNVEELASLYHFPELLVRTPTLKRTEVKKSDAPSDLPQNLTTQESGRGPDLRQQLINTHLDNKYYEKLYADKMTHTENIAKTKSKTTNVNKTDITNAESRLPHNLPIAE